MDQKHIGLFVLLVAVLIGGFIVISKANHDSHVQQIVQTQGSCFLEDGTCLHESTTQLYIFGWALAGALLLFGTYLTFFDKSQKIIAEQQVKVSEALASAKKQEREKDEFSAYVSGFTEDEQKVLRAVREQEGLQQSTLRYRTNISKTQLSLVLNSLEERQVISRKVKGKTKEVYLIKKF